MSDPRDTTDWILDPVGAYRYIDAVTRSHQLKSA